MFKITRFTVALTILLCLSTTGASAQGFGIEMGMPVESLDILEEIEKEPYTYAIAVPKPHSEFERYLVIAPPETGVCKVWGIGKNHDNDSYGTSVKAAFSILLTALESRYRDYKLYDFIRSEGIWDGPDEWVMSLRQSERTYIAFWTEDSKSNLSEGLEAISLGVMSLDRDTAYIVIQYEYDNIDECTQIIRDQDAGGL
jgi:hypothetical protein